MSENEEIRSFDLDHLFAAPTAQEPRYSLAGGADHLRDLFVGEQNLHADAARGFVAVALAPVEDEAGQFLAGGLRQSERADLARSDISRSAAARCADKPRCAR